MDEWKDLAEILASHPLRILGMFQMDAQRYLNLTLTVALGGMSRGGPPYAQIQCSNALDFLLRPMSPEIIEGGPPLIYHDPVSLAELAAMGCNDVNLTHVPAGDGEQFSPPLKLKLLVLDRSFVVAESFQVRSIASRD